MSQTQDKDALVDIVPLVLQQVKNAKLADEVWQAWNAALLAAAPVLDAATAERQVLAFATAKASKRDESAAGRLAACRMLAAALPALKGDTEVRLAATRSAPQRFSVRA